MWNITFCCRAAKATKEGLAPIEMVITIDGQRTLMRLPMKVNPSEFKSLTISKRDNYIKRFCDSERIRAYGIIQKMEVLGITITPTSVKDALTKGISTSYTLSNLQDEYTAILQKKVGIDLCLNVYKKYERVMKYVVKTLNNKECRAIINHL